MKPLGRRNVKGMPDFSILRSIARWARANVKASLGAPQTESFTILRPPFPPAPVTMIMAASFNVEPFRGCYTPGALKWQIEGRIHHEGRDDRGTRRRRARSRNGRDRAPDLPRHHLRARPRVGAV